METRSSLLILRRVVLGGVGVGTYCEGGYVVKVQSNTEVWRVLATNNPLIEREVGRILEREDLW